jgi:uncharacterized protein YhfF
VIGFTTKSGDLPSFAFGSSPEMADRLAALVIAGRKTGTCWSAADGDKGVQVGGRWIVKDGRERPVAIIETVELARLTYETATAEHARKEGEGDRSLAFWRKVHKDYFERGGGFAEGMPIFYETFRLIEVLDPEFADGVARHLAAEIAEARASGYSEGLGG